MVPSSFYLAQVQHLIPSITKRSFISFNVDWEFPAPALKWFQSYLTYQTQAACVEGEFSTPVPLQDGVPQGSVLGHLLYPFSTLPFGDILRKAGVSYHLCPCDTHIRIIRKSVTYKAYEKLTNVLTASRWYSCIATLYGIPEAQSHRIQSDSSECTLHILLLLRTWVEHNYWKRSSTSWR